MDKAPLLLSTCKPPEVAPTTGPSRPADDVLVSQRKLAERWGVCVKTVERRERDPAFKLPPPIVMNGRKYRWLSEIEAYERGLVRQITAA